MTDESRGYTMVGRWFGLGHEAVFHAGHEYVRGDVSSNAAESFFSQLKRSIDGTFHAVSHEHLHRYLAEFDFRHSTRKMADAHRVELLVNQVLGKRLPYRSLHAFRKLAYRIVILGTDTPGPEEAPPQDRSERGIDDDL
jgi:hypothetical protein